MEDKRNCGCNNGFLDGLLGGDNQIIIIIVIVLLLCNSGSGKCC